MANAASTSFPAAPDTTTRDRSASAARRPLTDEEVDRRVHVLLSTQRALLDEVFDNLRAVQVKDDGTTIQIIFYTDAEPDDDDVDSAGCVATEVTADFDDATRVEESLVVLPHPQRLPNDGGTYVFARRPPLEPLEDEQ